MKLKDKWLDILIQEMPQLNRELILLMFNNPNVKVKFYKEDKIIKGFIAYIKMNGWTNKLEFNIIELFIKKEFRNLKTLNGIIKSMEELAIGCDKIVIGSHSEFKSNTFMKYLERQNYTQYTLYKQLK